MTKPPREEVPPAGATIVRQIPMRDSRAAVNSLSAPATTPGGMTPVVASPLSAPPSDKSHQKLATLLEVSKGLTRAVDVDTILDKIVGYAYQTLEVDRVAILLVDSHGELQPKISRDKRGGDAQRSVPQSIARKAVSEKVALLSTNAGEDDRFGGMSIVIQAVRSAICAPLIGSEDRVLGVLYVDTPSITHQFGDEDLEFLVAFAGIAAVAIENSQFAERIRREGIVRSNFERYFAPQLAARIAGSPEALKLGGDKSTVAAMRPARGETIGIPGGRTAPRSGWSATVTSTEQPPAARPAVSGETRIASTTRPVQPPMPAPRMAAAPAAPLPVAPLPGRMAMGAPAVPPVPSTGPIMSLGAPQSVATPSEPAVPPKVATPPVVRRVSAPTPRRADTGGGGGNPGSAPARSSGGGGGGDWRGTAFRGN